MVTELTDLSVAHLSISLYPSANVDYTPRGPFEITFPPGSTRQEYSVEITDDFLSENSEFFNADVNIGRPENASRIILGHPKQPLIEIHDLRDCE